MTRAPRRANAWQIADPIPPEAPVTSTVTRVASSPLVIATSLPPRLDLRDFSFRQLPITHNLQANIEYCFYESGHMVYATDASLQKLHDNVADFIRRTSRGAQ